MFFLLFQTLWFSFRRKEKMITPKMVIYRTDQKNMYTNSLEQRLHKISIKSFWKPTWNEPAERNFPRHRWPSARTHMTPSQCWPWPTVLLPGPCPLLGWWSPAIFTHEPLDLRWPLTQRRSFQIFAKWMNGCHQKSPDLTNSENKDVIIIPIIKPLSHTG